MVFLWLLSGKKCGKCGLLHVVILRFSVDLDKAYQGLKSPSRCVEGRPKAEAWGYLEGARTEQEQGQRQEQEVVG